MGQPVGRRGDRREQYLCEQYKPLISINKHNKNAFGKYLFALIF